MLHNKLRTLITNYSPDKIDVPSVYLLYRLTN